MNTFKPHLPQLAALPAGVLCMAAHALAAQDPEIEQASSSQLRTAYLECDRISAESRVDQDFMVACQRVGEVLRDRDFEGDFERLLQWWRQARATTQSRAGETCPRQP